MRILVCGGRNYTNREYLESHIAEYCERDTVIITGMATGADTLASEWADKWGIAQEKYPANWKDFGKSAGSIRNQQMLDEGKPDLVVAFKGGAGTADMIRRAEKAGIKVDKFFG